MSSAEARLNRILIAATGVSLLLLAAGLGYFFYLVNASGRTGEAAEEKRGQPAGDTLRSGLAPVRPSGEPSAKKSGSAARSKPTASSKPAKPLPDVPPLAIGTALPEEPEAGGTLTISLVGKDAKGPPVRYQYRVKPDKTWREASGSKVCLSGLHPGSLTLEVRAVDEHGRSSAIVSRTWKVKPSAVAQRPRPTVWQKGQVFYQELEIARVSAYRFLGTVLGQNVQYRFLSSFRVEKVEADGGMVVVQRVEAAEFSNGDQAMQALLNDALKKTRGAAFRITLNRRREITRFKSGGDGIHVFEGKKGLGQAFLLWSFTDGDGWKELAQVTLFRPRQQGDKTGQWARPMTHSWGPLGHWEGRIVYQPVGREKEQERIGYALDMAYRPPRGDMAASLPFQITRAAFKPQTAAGLIAYDVDKGRVAAAEERFHVKGLLAIKVLGTDTVIEMDEAQLFRLRVRDTKPDWK
jgi:hypothetical protein